MAFDIHTLAAASFVSSLIQTIALSFQFRQDRRPAGTGWWAVGQGAISVGFALNYVRDLPLVGPWAVALNSVFFLLGLALVRVGISRFFGSRTPALPLWLVLGIAAAAAFGFTFIADDYGVRRLNLSLGAALLSLSVAKELFVNRRKETVLPVFLSGVFAAYSLFWLFRALSPLESAFSPTALTIAVYFITLTASSLWTFGFILLVSRHMAAEAREEHEKLRMVFESIPEAMIVTKLADGTIADHNEALLEMTGYEREELIGKTTVETKLWSNPLAREQFVERLRDGGRCINFESVFARKDGSRFDGMISARIFEHGGERFILSVVADISDRVQAERRIVQLAQQLEIEKTTALRNANTDGLTGLANRRLFDETLRREFFRAKRSGGSIALIMIDVDFFKKFNDAFGHLAGDDCLRRIAGVLSSTVRRSADLPARYGGEEFAVIVPDADSGSAARFAELIRASVADLGLVHPADEGGVVTVSLGVASARADYLEDSAALIRLADESLYRAKRNGRNRVECASIGAAADASADSFCLFWSSRNECGNRTVDAQHRRLFDDVNAMLSRLSAGPKDAAFLGALEALLDDAAAHFRDEAAILREAGYADLEAHERIHAELLDKAGGLLDAFRRDAAEEGRLVSFLVYDLVLQHMMAEDRKFFPLLRDARG